MLNLKTTFAPFCASILLSIVMLSVCGGGSSSEPTPTPPATPPVDTTPPPPTSLTITAVDGYLENAHAYIDLNENYQFDSGEPEATTDANGNATFDIAAFADAILKPIIVEAIAGTTIDQSLHTTVPNDYSLVAPPASTVVSPFTTLAQLSLIQEQQVDLDAAIAAIKTRLGLADDVDIMVDYLATGNTDEQLHAIARNIVQLLPAHASDLFAQGATPETINEVFATSGNIANAIIDAITQGADPTAIHVVLDILNNVNVRELTITDAMAFAGDVRQWGESINGNFVQSAIDFAKQIEAAAQIAESDSAELMSQLSTYTQAGLAAIALNQFREIDAGLIIAGATGTVTTTENNASTSAITINTDLNGQTVVASIVLNTEQGQQASLTAVLDSADVQITINEGSSISMNAANLTLFGLTLDTTINTKGHSEPVRFSGLFNVSTITLTKSDASTVVLPDAINLAGLFEIDDESFSAQLFLTLMPHLIDDAVDWGEITATLLVDAQFDDSPDAMIGLSLAHNSSGNTSVGFIILFGDRTVSAGFGIDDQHVVFTATNNEGIMMTLEFSLDPNDSFVGTITIATKEAAVISRVNGKFIITYTDGTIETIF